MRQETYKINSFIMHIMFLNLIELNFSYIFQFLKIYILTFLGTTLIMVVNYCLFHLKG
jgi:hypothetical protein